MRTHAPIPAALAVAAALASCGAPPRPDTIVLITLDTTRADRLGCYGYEAADTPALDALAGGGALFLEALAPVPVTLPSHASMFTGHEPPVHGVRYNGMFRLGDGAVTVAELLRDAGWHTVGIPAAFPLTESTGIGQGFEVYDDKVRGVDLARARLEDVERTASEVTARALAALDAAGDRPLFLWLHYWDPHFPYAPPFPYSASHRDRPYDGEIAFMDREIGRVLDALRERGRWDRTLVVVAGDHGEGLYDHGEKMHANLVYQSTMHVPLIVRAPGSSQARRIAEPVGLIDVAPTILDFAGVERPAMDGISLRPAVDGGELPARDLYFESLAGSLAYGWSPLEGVRRGAWKFIRSPEPELFDLDADPGETQNLYGVSGPTADELEASLDAMLDAWRGTAPDAVATPTPVDREQAELLLTLGYVGGFVAEERRDGADPKKLIHLDLEIFAARDQGLAGDWAGALARVRRVLEEDPTNRMGLLLAGGAAGRLGDREAALGHTGRCLEVYPEFLPARILHGETLVAEGRVDEAYETFRAGLAYHPEDPGLIYRTGVAAYASGRTGEALELASAMVERGAESPSFLLLEASCRAKLGDPDGALRALRAAIARGYRDREVLTDEPLLEPLRAVPGFADALAEIPAS